MSDDDERRDGCWKWGRGGRKETLLCLHSSSSRCISATALFSLLLVLYYWTYQCTYMAGRVSVNEGRWESISHPLCLVTNP